MKLIFMGTPDFAVPTLQALIDSAHEVVAVYSQPPRPAGRGHKESASPIHQLGAQHDIAVFTPTSLKNHEAQHAFAAHGADAAIVAAYGLILPPAILQACPMGCINVHPSDLPRWRGAAPIQHTLMAGDTSSAMCIMQMDAGLDTGDVLMRETLAIDDDMTAGQLHDEMAQLGATLVMKTLAHYHDMVRQPQRGDATYAHKITKETAQIDWTQSARHIRNHIRGLCPYPAAWTTIADEKIKIFSGELCEGNAAPGSAINEHLTVACGDGALRITELQRPGKKRMRADDALRGWSVPKGSILS